MRGLRDIATPLLPCLAALAAAAVVTAAPTTDPGGFTRENESLVPRANLRESLSWYDDLDNALAIAGEEYRPVVVLFHSPTDGWSRRMRAQVVSDSAVQEQLQHYIRVEVAIEDHADAAADYLVRNIPAVRILSAEGRMLQGHDGFVDAPEMVRMLRASLNAEFLEKSDPEFQERVKALEENAVAPEEWPAVMVALGKPKKRETLRRLILELDPFPREKFVDLLSHSRLSVRLGTLEILEEISGSAFGFDPWAGSPDTPANRKALKKWSEWMDSSGDGAISSVYSVLTEEQIASYLRDMVGDDRERSTRARNLLRSGGENVARSLRSFLDHNPDLSPPARRRVRELHYAITLPAIGGSDPDSLAHRLVHGNLDARLEAIGTLKGAGRSALPVLKDFLDASDPLVRETAVDAVLEAGLSDAVPAVESHLEGETEEAVLFSALRAIGVNEIRSADDLVARYADHGDEDLSIVALNSLGTLRAVGQSDVILGQLEDDRWRVRVAALETIGELKQEGFGKRVRPLLEDEDDFVRIAAVQTLADIGDTGARDDLVTLYRRDEAARGPVIGALLSLELPLPDSITEDLAASAPESILSTIEAVDDNHPPRLEVVAPFVTHENLDVSCASIRLVAEDGMSQTRYQRQIADILADGTPEQKVAALESLQFTEYQFRRYRRHHGSGEEATKEIPATVQEIYDVLLQRESPQGEADRSRADPLLSIFSSAESLFLDAEDGAIRHPASLLLAQGGYPPAIETLEDEMEERSVAERKAIAEELDDAAAGALPVLVGLMRDPAEEVRTAAATAVLEQGNERKFLETFFEELTRPAPDLKPWEVDLGYLDNHLGEGIARKIANRRAKAILEDSIDPALRSLAALVLRYAWKYGDEEALLPLTESEEPELRRVAWFAIGRNAEKALEPHLSTIVSDPSAKVRSMLPFVLGRRQDSLVHHFDDEHSQRYYDYLDSHRAMTVPRVGDEALEALHELSTDSSPRVRIDSSFVLMAQGETPDPAALESTLSAFPDRDGIESRVSDYLEENYQRLDPAYEFLLDYLETDRISTSTLGAIHARFERNTDSDGEEQTLEWRERKAAAPDTETDPRQVGKTPPADSPEGEAAVEVHFFYKPGCRECDRVRGHLREMRASFPRLQILDHNIRQSDSARLNEALSERFGVPEKIRMVTPAVFTADGYRIKDDTYPTELGELIRRSSSTGNSRSGWAALDSGEMERAGSAIEGRYSSVGLAVILSAGMLDGLNPCAFATIILFLSYLQVAQHGPRQILAVGLAFIAAVFLTYFALGLGLVELVTGLQFLEDVALAFNLALAAFALVIMFLSLRDGVFCLQGRMADTALQLPVFLKERIRRVARTGARHRRFVVAAFLSGVVISLLELACTGQVYLPTINYMVQEGNTSAYFLLLLYNLAFVLPLVIIFVLAFYGLRSETLIAFQQKHGAAIKFATAALFLVLATLLLLPLFE